MKILHISPSYKPAFLYGGPTISVTNLCEAQAAAGLQVTVLTTRANGKQELDYSPGSLQESAGVRVYYYRRWTGDHSHFSPALLFKTWSMCRQADVVHIHSWWNLVAIPATLLCLLRGCTPVLSPRGMLSPYTLKNPLKRLFHRWIGCRILERTLMHATSEQEAAEALELVPKWAYFIAPNIVQWTTEDVPLNMQRPKGDLRMVFLSRIDPKKGLDLLFHALSALKDPNWLLTIAGNGDLPYIEGLQRLAQTLQISDRIRWAGWVEGEAKTRLLLESDLFVLTSHNENFANAALEALLAGTPVLLTELVGLSCYVRETGFGRVCTVEREAVAKAIDDFRQQEVTITRPAIAERVRRDFDPMQIAESYVEQYRKHVFAR